MTHHTCYPFRVAVNVVKHPRKKLVPVITYVLAAINSHSLTGVSSFLSLTVNKTGKIQLVMMRMLRICKAVLVGKLKKVTALPLSGERHRHSCFLREKCV